MKLRQTQIEYLRVVQGLTCSGLGERPTSIPEIADQAGVSNASARSAVLRLGARGLLKVKSNGQGITGIVRLSAAGRKVLTRTAAPATKKNPHPPSNPSVQITEGRTRRRSARPRLVPPPSPALPN